MRGICIGLLLVLVAAGGAFAETAEKVASDADILLGVQQDRSAANHLFMEDSVLMSYENRIKLNDYRTKFNALGGRIYVLKNQITTALNAREPNVTSVTNLRQQLQSLIDQHDSLINEFKQWTTSLR
jgi:hypothetical protein